MDEELKKILDEINLKRKSQKSKTTSVRPTSNVVVNMDFASLYPTQQKWWNVKPLPDKVIIRKSRIKRIFN